MTILINREMTQKRLDKTFDECMGMDMTPAQREVYGSSVTNTVGPLRANSMIKSRRYSCDQNLGLVIYSVVLR